VWRGGVEGRSGGEVWRGGVEGRCGGEVWSRGVEGRCGGEVWRRGVEERCGGEVWRRGVEARCGGEPWGRGVDAAARTDPFRRDWGEGAPHPGSGVRQCLRQGHRGIPPECFPGGCVRVLAAARIGDVSASLARGSSLAPRPTSVRFHGPGVPPRRLAPGLG
jgi:hypothetical protein